LQSLLADPLAEATAVNGYFTAWAAQQTSMTDVLPKKAMWCFARSAREIEGSATYRVNASPSLWTEWKMPAGPA